MIIQKATIVPANETNENVFSGSTFEFPRTNAVVSIGSVGNAVGLFITILAGGNVVLEESPPAISTDFPLIPDEFYYNFAMLSGERLVVRCRNSTGASITLRTIAQMTSVR